MVSTLQLNFFSKSGRMTGSRPESAVLVVVASLSAQPETAGLLVGWAAGGWVGAAAAGGCVGAGAGVVARPQAASNRVKMVNPMSKRLSFIFSSPD
jgi:hypothetical protein